MIEVENLVKGYGGHLAANHLSFRMEGGQIYDLLGLNGTGKPTTMSVMTGYLGATEGQVIIGGHDVLEEPEAAKKRIGYLPEIPSLYMDMTMDEYLKLAACIKKLPEPGCMDTIQKVTDLVRITDARKRLTRNLSKGYRQRVGMAQVVLEKLFVIILDEPTVGLDPKQVIEIRDMIEGLGKQHTVILSSYILFEVSIAYDHIAVIAHGKLIASDTPENLEQRLKDAAGLDLTVKGSAEVLRPVLEEIRGLSIEHMEVDSEDGTCAANLQFVGGGDTIDSDSAEFPDLEADVYETIFYTLANHHLLILSMAPSKVSLEEILLELTEDCPKTREDGGAADPMDQSEEEEPQ